MQHCLIKVLKFRKAQSRLGPEQVFGFFTDSGNCLTVTIIYTDEDSVPEGPWWEPVVEPGVKARALESRLDLRKIFSSCFSHEEKRGPSPNAHQPEIVKTGSTT